MFLLWIYAMSMYTHVYHYPLLESRTKTGCEQSHCVQKIYVALLLHYLLKHKNNSKVDFSYNNN